MTSRMRNDDAQAWEVTGLGGLADLEGLGSRPIMLLCCVQWPRLRDCVDSSGPDYVDSIGPRAALRPVAFWEGLGELEGEDLGDLGNLGDMGGLGRVWQTLEGWDSRILGWPRAHPERARGPGPKPGAGLDLNSVFRSRFVFRFPSLCPRFASDARRDQNENGRRTPRNTV